MKRRAKESESDVVRWQRESKIVIKKCVLN